MRAFVTAFAAGKTDSFNKFTAAYQETQPKPLYAEEEDAEEK